MISGFGSPQIADRGDQRFRYVPGTRERGMEKMRGIVALSVALTLGLGSSALLAQKAADPKKEVKRSKAEQVDIDVLANTVDAVTAGRPAPTDIGVTWELNHFFRAPDGTTYIPFTVNVDKSKLTAPTTAVYVRVANKGAAPAAPAKNSKDKNAVAHPWEKIDFATVGADGKLSRYLQVKPGTYDVYVAVKDKGTVEKLDNKYTPTMGVLKHELTVPDFTQAELATSSMLLSTGIQPAANGQTPDDDPYIFGQMQIMPSKDGKYKKTDTLSVVYWVYGATGDAAGKPDITVENTFNQKTAEGEKFFNKTQPQALNASSPYSASMGVPNFLEVPLVSFAPGDYRLEIKITDKPSGKTVTQNVNFTVAAS
jgi:hypothetical protein